MNKTMHKLIALLLALMMCVSLAACGSVSNNNDADNGSASGSGETTGTDSSAETVSAEDTPAEAEDRFVKINVQASADPGHFQPFSATNSAKEKYEFLVYDTLFKDVEMGAPTPLIAKSYERPENGLYIVTIHDNVYDHAGNHITADDVVFCYQSVLDKNERSTTMSDLEKVVKTGDYTVEFHLREDRLKAFSTIATTVGIVSQKAYEASANGFSDDPIGCGPYTIKEWVPGSYIIFEKYEDYWNKDSELDYQACDEIEYKIITEATQVAIALETGEIDFANDLSIDDANRLEGDSSSAYNVLHPLQIQVLSLIFNFDSSSLMSDVRLRQAVCYAIDPNAILTSAYRGAGGVAYSLSPPSRELFVDYQESWNEELPYAYNPEKAKELLKEAGYENGLKIRLMTRDFADNQATAQVIQSFLGEVGIEVEILVYENALYQTYRYDHTMWDINIGGVGGTEYCPTAWEWYLIANAQSGKNMCMSDDPVLQEKLFASLMESSHSDETVDDLWQYVKDEAFIYPLVYTYMNFACNKGIEPHMGDDGVSFRPNMSTYTSDFNRTA